MAPILPRITITSPCEVSEVFHLVCKIAIDAGVSRREMEAAVDAAWRMKAQLEALPSLDSTMAETPEDSWSGREKSAFAGI